MNTEDLYKQSPCPKCGRAVFDTASFCPHCGYVKKQRRWEDMLSRKRGEGEAREGGPKATGLTVSVLLGLGFAGYLIYRAVTEESLQSFIMAVFVLLAVLQSWLAARKRAQQKEGEAGEHTGEAVEQAEDPLEQKFFCENCGTKVAADATECPKCGMKFG